MGGSLEEFIPLTPPVVKIYSCGPTVYRFAHIGNLRTYLLSDTLVRVLRSQGFRVIHVKNITDVGHMRQEFLERGEDKVIAAARAEGKTPRDIADFFSEAYFRDEGRMNFIPADTYPRATDHIPETIDLIQSLVNNGYTYEREGTIYFDVKKFSDYGALSGNRLGELREGHRMAGDSKKKHPSDFILWRKAEERREMKWNSPWGKGYPGWHIECSAMSMKYLGESFDFHIGGIDLVFPHHENEIAQARCGEGAAFAKYWIHGGHLLVEGQKMSKSAGNEHTLDGLKNLGFTAIDFRYRCLYAQYRTMITSTHVAQEGAKRGHARLKHFALDRGDAYDPERALYRAGKELDSEFKRAVLTDLNMPRALATVWKALRTNIDRPTKATLLKKWDLVLGLDLFEEKRKKGSEYLIVEELAKKRQDARKAGRYREADLLREEIEKLGYQVTDTSFDFRLRKKE